jgi:methionyl-tRNA synthetase
MPSEKPEKILVAVAWPYANGSIHIGHVAGTYLPADIFARYHRKKGNEVLMVSGADAHGTPVTLEAETRGVSPEVIATGYLTEFLDNWERLGISFDLFTSTHTDNHAAVSQDMFAALKANGYIYPDTTLQPYSEVDNRFLADRYVEGTCPHCAYAKARGDQCENCGRTLDAKDLIDIRSRDSGDIPVFKETTHYFFKLSAFQSQLERWMSEDKDAWRANVLNFTRGFLQGGLKDRPITRDIEWGVPLPAGDQIEHADRKRLYVWFEAVIGYLSASKEWAHKSGDPEAWKSFWTGDARAYHFMGKDNITFHTILWPAMLLGYGGLNLPHDVPANEFLNMEGFKLSTSGNWAVWLPDYLERYEPDPLRYVVAANMPETSDSDFSWREYVRANNDELVATWGNLVHRVLTMSNRNFNGAVPAPSAARQDAEGEALLAAASTLPGQVGSDIGAAQFRRGLERSMALAKQANRYVENRAPWKAVKSDPDHAATTLWTALSVVNCLKTTLYPYLPFTCQKLHEMLGFDGRIQDQSWGWDEGEMKPGAALQSPEPLFAKLDESVVQEEVARLGT